MGLDSREIQHQWPFASLMFLTRMRVANLLPVKEWRIRDVAKRDRCIDT
jgi:hypothetical protein